MRGYTSVSQTVAMNMTTPNALRRGVEVQERRPRHRTERISDSGFLGTMRHDVTCRLPYCSRFLRRLSVQSEMETETFARTHAFATLVFAELLRSLGARSGVKAVWL